MLGKSAVQKSQFFEYFFILKLVAYAIKFGYTIFGCICNHFIGTIDKGGLRSLDKNICQISKFASILYRLGQPYFDRALAKHRLGCGQQFFLLRIYENPGITMLDLAKKGHFDKGTTNRAVTKLEQLGYIQVLNDESDRRVRRLYVTEKANLIANDIYDMLKNWNALLTEGMSPEEIHTAEHLLEKLADNAFRYTHCYQLSSEDKKKSSRNYEKERRD